MQYQTTVLKLIQDRPPLCVLLRKERLMLKAAEVFARELQASYEAWICKLESGMRGEPRALMEARAQELALSEIEARLPAKTRNGNPSPSEVVEYVKARSK